MKFYIAKVYFALFILAVLSGVFGIFLDKVHSRRLKAKIHVEEQNMNTEKKENNQIHNVHF